MANGEKNGEVYCNVAGVITMQVPLIFASAFIFQWVNCDLVRSDEFSFGLTTFKMEIQLVAGYVRGSADYASLAEAGASGARKMQILAATVLSLMIVGLICGVAAAVLSCAGSSVREGSSQSVWFLKRVYWFISADCVCQALGFALFGIAMPRALAQISVQDIASGVLDIRVPALSKEVCSQNVQQWRLGAILALVQTLLLGLVAVHLLCRARSEISQQSLDEHGASLQPRS